VRLQRQIVLVLAASFAASSLPASETAVVRGSLSASGGAGLAAGLAVRLVEVRSGLVTQAQERADGSFETAVAPGDYALEVPGYRVANGAVLVAARAGTASKADLVVEPATGFAPDAPLQISHEPVGCLVAEEHVEIEAAIRPPAQVKKARVYFKTAHEKDFHYVEMVPEIGRFVACLPEPHKDAGPVVYYIDATPAAGTPSSTSHNNALVVPKAAECPKDKRTAAPCPCRVPVAVFDPAGNPVTALADAGGVAGGAAGGAAGGTAAIVAIGASAVGVGFLLQEEPASPSR
jgi:hypothetical protein